MSASCSSEPDSRRSLIMGLRSVRPSEFRFSCETAMTGDVEVLGQELEVSRHRGDFLLARLDLAAACHELEVVDDDEAEVFLLLEAAALRADFGDGDVRGVVDE